MSISFTTLSHAIFPPYCQIQKGCRNSLFFFSLKSISLHSARPVKHPSNYIISSRDTPSMVFLAFWKQSISFGENVPHSPFVIMLNACSFVNAFL